MAMINELLAVFDFERIAQSEDGNNILILGYKIDLTDKETELLNILHESKKSVSKNALAERVGIARSAVSVHIANINKKALPITGRRLVEGNRRGYYKISDNI